VALAAAGNALGISEKINPELHQSGGRRRMSSAKV
jgi:hypothetical protein